MMRLLVVQEDLEVSVIMGTLEILLLSVRDG